MWLVSVSVMLAVVQCASSDGGSPRLPTRITPPLRGASAARATLPATIRTAIMASHANRAGTQRLMHVPPERCADECVDCARGGNACQRQRRERRGMRARLRGWERAALEGRSPLRRVKRAAAAQGTVMVVPSPVAVMEKVPAVLDV